MASVDGAPVRVGRAEGGDGLEAHEDPAAVEEAEHRGSAVELAEPAPELGVGEDAASVRPG